MLVMTIQQVLGVTRIKDIKASFRVERSRKGILLCDSIQGYAFLEIGFGYQFKNWLITQPKNAFLGPFIGWYFEIGSLSYFYSHESSIDPTGETGVFLIMKKGAPKCFYTILNRYHELKKNQIEPGFFAPYIIIE